MNRRASSVAARSIPFMIAVLAFLAPGASAWEAHPVGRQTLEDRQVIRFEHPLLAEWGYAGGTQFFSLIEPVKKMQPAPLIVYLHSAGGGKEVQVPLAARVTGQCGPEFYGLALNCGENEWWWGFHDYEQEPEKYAVQLTPVEKRVMASVEWAMRHYPIDPNRVYLTGHSMGGSGSMGIGLPRGDVFAAIRVEVPAGVQHAALRMNWPLKLDPPRPKSAADIPTLPDPPPLVNFSSQTDDWAVGEEDLLRVARERKLSLIFAWGPWGHTIDFGREACPAALDFKWHEIRKDEAYPAFTSASSDRQYPGLKGTSLDQLGQINAYFRWKNLRDDAEAFGIELRLADEGTPHPAGIPPTTVRADVTLRRLQRFKIQPDAEYAWQLRDPAKSAWDSTITHGTLMADQQNLLTIPRLEITSAPRELWLRPLPN